MTRSMSYASKVGFGATSGSAATAEIEFDSCTLGNAEELIGGEGLTGERSVHHASKVKGVERPDGELVIECRPDVLDLFLPPILGAAESVDVFALADTLPAIGIDVEKVGQAFRYAGVYVNRATFRSVQGQLMKLSLELMSKTETAITFPSIGSTLSEQQPYVHHQGVLTIDSVGYPFNNMELVIDNQLDGEHFFNSKTRTEIDPQGRLITLAADVKFTATEYAAFYDMAIAGVAGTLVFTNGALLTTFTFGILQTSKQPVQVPGKAGELIYRCNFEVNKDYGTPTESLAVTNVSV